MRLPAFLLSQKKTLTMPRTKTFDEQDVLEKAIDLFWKKGYHATSMQDLVEHLGINRASLYSTFGNKETLFERAILHYRATNQRGLRSFLFSQPDVRTGLSALFRRAIDESVSDPDRKGCFVVNTVTELAPHDQKIKAMADENQQGFLDILITYLQTGVDRGEISSDKDLEAIAMLLFTLYNGLKVVGKVELDGARLEGAIQVALRSIG